MKASPKKATVNQKPPISKKGNGPAAKFSKVPMKGGMKGGGKKC